MIIQPGSDIPPEAHPVRLDSYEVPFSYAELWLLMHIGPGNTGAADLMGGGRSLEPWN